MDSVIYAHDAQGHRVDVHRPSAINPGDYTYLKVAEKRAALKVGQKVAGPGGVCHHCGKAIVWEVYYRYEPTGDVVTFGYICAGILDMTDNRIDHEMNLLKRAAANERREEEWAKQTEDRRADWEAQYPEESAFVRDYKGEFGQDFINRLRWGIEKYGSPLDYQIESLKKFIAGRKAFVAQQQIEEKQLENAPLLSAGRQHIEGTVVTVKVQHSDYYGDTVKMLVKLDDGNKVFGTVPGNIAGVEKDDRVSFDAKVEVKEDHFGYYSRPTKAQVI